MVEKATRHRVTDEPRAADAWEVFVRDDEGDQLRHVGSVVADSAADAHERATRLFAWYADDVWVAPADAVERFTVSEGDGAEPVDVADGTEPRTHEL